MGHGQFRTSLRQLLVLQGVTYTLKFVKTPVLARLLAPEDFGLIGVANVLVIAFQNITALGLSKLIIQRKQVETPFLATVWAAMILRGGLITVFCLAVAPFYSHFVNSPSTMYIIFALSAVPFLNALKSPLIYVKERSLEFKSIARFEMLSQLGSLMIVTALAIALRDVWALVLGIILGHVFQVLASYVYFRPTFFPKVHSREYLLESVKFGRHFAIIAVGTYITSQADNLLVGKLLGPQLLGIYVVSYSLINLPNDFFQRIINRVSLPVFSRSQDSVSSIVSLLRRITSFQLFLIMAIYGGIFIFAHQIVLVIYGTKWHAAGPIVQALVLMGISRSLGVSLLPATIGTGNVKINAIGKTVETCFFIPATYYFITTFGLPGAALGSGVSYLSGTVVRYVLFVALPLFSGQRKSVAAAALKPVMATVPFYCVIIYVNSTVEYPTAVSFLCWNGAMFIAATVLPACLFFSDALRHVKQIVAMS